MADSDSCKLFVAGLSDTASEAALRELFESTGGSVVDIAVPRDRQTGVARGFGFVTLSTEAEAVAARQQLDGSFFDGRSLSVRAFRGNRNASPGAGEGGGGFRGGAARSERPDRHQSDRHQDDRESTLFVANLPLDCTQSDLSEAFEQAGVGPIVRLHLPVDPEGRRRGFGFLSLSDPAAARAAVTALKGLSIGGRAIAADIARPRGERVSAGDSGGGGGSWRSRAPAARDVAAPPPVASSLGNSGASSPAPGERQTWDERRGSRRKEAPKRKKERAKPRRESEGAGFRGSRSRGFDEWDED